MNKTPLIRLAKREDMAKWKIWTVRFGAFVLAFLLGMVLFAIAGVKPLEAYAEMISGALGKASGLRQVA